MKVAFFGLKQSFDYFQIGGSESLVRRLSATFIIKGSEVYYVLYGEPAPRKLNQDGINLNYCRSV
ncbi:MAG: hypothetical protein ACTSRG_27290, partial [Candidatus Helarchaeota archaeon]